MFTCVCFFPCNHYSCRGTLCLIEWKTSKKPKDSLDSCYDYPLQVAAYAGAYNSTRSKDDQVCTDGAYWLKSHNLCAGMALGEHAVTGWTLFCFGFNINCYP